MIVVTVSSQANIIIAANNLNDLFIYSFIYAQYTVNQVTPIGCSCYVKHQYRNIQYRVTPISDCYYLHVSLIIQLNFSLFFFFENGIGTGTSISYCVYTGRTYTEMVILLQIEVLCCFLERGF